MGEESKSFQALLNGIIRHDYYDDCDITDDFLKNELSTGLKTDDFDALLLKGRKILKSMVTINMDQTQAENFLMSQSKKQDTGITEAQAKVFQKIWKNHREKIHQSFVEKCMWDNTLKRVQWRIDVKTKSMQSEHLNVPTAIVEMQIGSRGGDTRDDEVVRFEMDEDSVSKFVHSLKDIEQQIEAHIQKT